MRYCLAFFLLLPPISITAQQLTVKAASARHVLLGWTGSGACCIVERKAGDSPWQKLATPGAGGYEDTAIDPWATYHYRIRAGEQGQPSNEVTVGPPPAGVLKAAPAPKGVDPAKYGVNTAVALDENGDPAIAFVWSDPNGDNDTADTEVMFVRWDRARYRWTDPVKVATVGGIQTQNLQPVSLAIDRPSATIAIAYPVAGHDGMVDLAASKDGGATWQFVTVHNGLEGTVWSTALALANGRVSLAVNCEGSRVQYIAGDAGADSSKWKAQAAPYPAGTRAAPSTNLALVLDSSGNAVTAYVVAPEDGDNMRYAVWRPGSGQAPAIAMDSNNQGVDRPDVSLSLNGRAIALIASAPRDQSHADLTVWYTASIDGAKWSPPVMLPVDGPRSTNPPLSVALDSHGAAAAVYGSNSGSGEARCGNPVVARSPNGAAWKACGPGHDFSPQPDTVNAIFGGNDKLYVLWHEASENKVGMGVLISHDR
ncbi:MAG TPA: hypothetical protein VFA04_02890 [Bryobacteraceae bacterium]|nr:hypothetical protein [Bryobacteraceae bacterium]